MSTWELLKKRLNPQPVVKKAEVNLNHFSPSFTDVYIKTAESFDVSADEAIEQLKKLDDATARNS